MKRAIVNVTPEMLANICKSTGNEKIILSIDGVPEDAKFITASFNPNKDCFAILFEHDSFCDILSGRHYPEIMVTHTKYQE